MQIHDVGWWVPSTQAITYLFQKIRVFEMARESPRSFIQLLEDALTHNELTNSLYVNLSTSNARFHSSLKDSKHNSSA